MLLAMRARNRNISMIYHFSIEFVHQNSYFSLHIKKIRRSSLGTCSKYSLIFMVLCYSMVTGHDYVLFWPARKFLWETGFASCFDICQIINRCYVFRARGHGGRLCFIELVKIWQMSCFTAIIFIPFRHTKVLNTLGRPATTSNRWISNPASKFLGYLWARSWATPRASLGRSKSY